MGITQVKAREPKFNPLNRHCGRTLTLRFLQGESLALALPHLKYEILLEQKGPQRGSLHLPSSKGTPEDPVCDQGSGPDCDSGSGLSVTQEVGCQ